MKESVRERFRVLPGKRWYIIHLTQVPEGEHRENVGDIGFIQTMTERFANLVRKHEP